MPKQIPQTFGTGPMPKTKKMTTWESFWHGSDANTKRRFILALGLFWARVQRQKYYKATPPSDPFGTKADQGVEHVSYPTACSAHVPRSAQPRPGLRRASDAIDVKRIQLVSLRSSPRSQKTFSPIMLWHPISKCGPQALM